MVDFQAYKTTNLMQSSLGFLMMYIASSLVA